MDFSKLSEWLKLKPRYLVALALICGILLLSPERFVTFLGLQGIVASYRGWIGATFIISNILLLVHIAAYLGDPIERRINDWRFVLVHSQRLRDLSPGEKDMLKRFVDQDTRSQDLNISDGVAQGLVRKRILIRVSNLGDAGGWFAHNIQPWAWNYLKKHPDLLS